MSWFKAKYHCIREGGKLINFDWACTHHTVISANYRLNHVTIQTFLQRFFQSPVSWFKAKYHCIRKGGKLVEDLAQGDGLNHLPGLDSGDLHWIGGNDLAKNVSPNYDVF